jgi:hypothetical protein
MTLIRGSKRRHGSRYAIRNGATQNKILNIKLTQRKSRRVRLGYSWLDFNKSYFCIGAVRHIFVGFPIYKPSNDNAKGRIQG